VNASDSDGTISRVELFVNGQKVGEDQAAPFAFSWTPASAGTYTLTARATDDDGAANTSPSVSFIASAPPAAPPEIAAKPVPPASACALVALTAVIDGDTLQVRAGEVNERVRISQVDAPERSQPYGIEATACLSRLVTGRAITICRDGRDRYGRTIADVTANGADVGRGLVEQGCAWAYTKYLEPNSVLPNLEANARDARVGLWSLASAVEPWLYRSGTSPVTYDTTTGFNSVAIGSSNRGTVYDRVFDWAEHQYPELLVNGSGNQVLGDGTIYRCYSTGFCVGYRPGVFLTYDGKAIKEVGTEAALLAAAVASGF
jgi:endonuclease YncB( thermonuclease family)